MFTSWILMLWLSLFLLFFFIFWIKFFFDICFECLDKRCWFFPQMFYHRNRTFSDGRSTSYGKKPWHLYFVFWKTENCYVLVRILSNIKDHHQPKKNLILFNIDWEIINYIDNALEFVFQDLFWSHCFITKN